MQKLVRFLGLGDEIHTGLTEFEPDDEYTGENVGLGQDLLGLREDPRTRK